VKVDDQPVSDPGLNVPVSGEVKVSLGKKKHGLLVAA
jgi:tyrosyl-tRNA synthetase